MQCQTESHPIGVQVLGFVTPEYAEILTPEALKFVEKLCREFSERRKWLLNKRKERQLNLDRGEKLSFLPDTEHIRTCDWTVDPVPEDLQDRRVEITGPAGDRKMVINALNSGAKTFMADFEDANSPTWENCILGQINMRDAVRRNISFTNPDGKQYQLAEKVATLLVRPRGWHMEEKHVLLDGQPISASLFDFGLYFYHNAKALLDRGSGPYFYLPKLESHLEARLWNDVFEFSQLELGVPKGTIKATVLIETILATFEMHEILFELKQHSAGLNCGRWDYIFSYMKKLRNQMDAVLPDRSLITMTVPFMRAYTQLTIQTCHRRNAHAIGGMAAQIPVKNDPEANSQALEKVRTDKEREARDGHDGTWVAHPALVPVATQVFDAIMPTSNQLHNKREDVQVTCAELVEPPKGAVTEAGLRTNISIGLQYIEAWLRGFGAVPIFNLMEDAATAEISRAQIWQWIRQPDAVLDNGCEITWQLVERLIEEELKNLEQTLGETAFHGGRFKEARQIFAQLVQQDDFEEFLTLPGYEYL